MATRHLVTVWNPAYLNAGMDAMDAHVALLVERARRHRDGELPEEEVHVWWGKIRSERRQGELPHLADVLELDRQIEAEEPTYLYLTDYNSLYVADLARITVDDIRVTGESAIPAYYRQRECDLWFQLWDIRRLVAQDTRAVVEELRRLKNTRYHDQPVSLYGGVLRDNLFGSRIWNLMEPATRTFLASAEAVVRARREDPAFDFSGPALEYAKAVETETNAVLFGYLRRALEDCPTRDRLVRVEGRELDLGRPVPHQTLGALRRLLGDEPTVKDALRRVALAHVSYFTDPYKLPRQLEAVQKLRNPAAHSGAVDREALLGLRDELLGIGGMGVLVELVMRKGEV